MVLSKQAQLHRPKRPMNAYFTYRLSKLKQLSDDQDKNNKIKQLWQSIDPKLKADLQRQFKTDTLTFDDRLEAWKKKYKVSDEDLAKKVGKKKDEKDHKEEKDHLMKTKGIKEVKKIDEKEKDNKKDDKSKSVTKTVDNKKKK